MSLGIVLAKGLVQVAPGNRVGKAEQGIIRIQLLQQIGTE